MIACKQLRQCSGHKISFHILRDFNPIHSKPCYCLQCLMNVHGSAFVQCMIMLTTHGRWIVNVPKFVSGLV